jgi:NIMA (never in mitosis gene a)-related kinase
LIVSYLVLYSAKQDIWKIADFGLSAPQSSSRTTISTQFSRGTPCYRAPELLVESPTFSYRVDIWALGCILYELALKKKAFMGDWAVLDYSVMKKKLVVGAEGFVELYTLTLLTNLIHRMLEIDPKERPNARELHELFNILVMAAPDVLAFQSDNPLLLKILQSGSCPIYP